MNFPQQKSLRQEQIDVNFRCDTTSEICNSAASCGCRNACDPILHMDGTVTTCSSTGGTTTSNLKINDAKRDKISHNQTNTAFTSDENTFDRAFRNNGMK